MAEIIIIILFAGVILAGVLLFWKQSNKFRESEFKRLNEDEGKSDPS